MDHQHSSGKVKLRNIVMQMAALISSFANHCAYSYISISFLATEGATQAEAISICGKTSSGICIWTTKVQSKQQRQTSHLIANNTENILRF